MEYEVSAWLQVAATAGNDELREAPAERQAEIGVHEAEEAGREVFSQRVEVESDEAEARSWRESGDAKEAEEGMNKMG